ncbi:type I restriction endonuclease subunit S [Candidatus Woesearchaeota archaeon CG10_big_fil_rev_8_21_14_0_10_37_12]|nr:MAG: type I restriction endonuclease subunit S [Candidatus Woesearchaeota archaeon CG10_big_fil_rev_8_21_14_0_10_37_12]
MKLKPYPKYKDSGVQWIGEIPEEWGVKKLKIVADVNISNIDKKSSDFEPYVKLCNYTDVYYNDFITSDIIFMVATASHQQISKLRLKEGDVLITKDSEEADDIAIPALVKETFKDVVCGYHLAHIRPNKLELLGSYLFRLFKSKNVSDYFTLNANGVTRFGISTYPIKNVQILLPSLPEQEKMITFLDSKTSQFDQTIEKDKQLIELLKEKRTALINHVVTKGLDKNAKMKDSGIDWIGEIPEGWSTRRIDKLSKVSRGASPRPIDDPIYFDEKGEYSWVRIADVSSSDRYLEESSEKLSVLGKSLSVALESGRLFVSIAGTVGKPIITKIKCCIHDGFVYFKNLKVNNEYLYYIFIGEQAYLGLGKWGTQLNLNTETIGLIAIPLPDDKEQHQIVQYLDKETSKIDQIIKKIEEKINLMEEYKKSLIHHVVTGKIDVRGVAL